MSWVLQDNAFGISLDKINAMIDALKALTLAWEAAPPDEEGWLAKPTYLRGTMTATLDERSGTRG